MTLPHLVKLGMPLYCGEAIRTRLSHLDMRQTDLATALEVDESIVNRWIVNQRPVPSYRILPVAAVLQVDPEWLESQDECYEHAERQDAPLAAEAVHDRPAVRPGTATLSGYTIGGGLFMRGVR